MLIAPLGNEFICTEHNIKCKTISAVIRAVFIKLKGVTSNA